MHGLGRRTCSPCWTTPPGGPTDLGLEQAAAIPTALAGERIDGVSPRTYGPSLADRGALAGAGRPFRFRDGIREVRPGTWKMPTWRRCTSISVRPRVARRPSGLRMPGGLAVGGGSVGPLRLSWTKLRRRCAPTGLPYWSVAAVIQIWAAARSDDFCPGSFGALNNLQHWRGDPGGRARGQDGRPVSWTRRGVETGAGCRGGSDPRRRGAVSQHPVRTGSALLTSVVMASMGFAGLCCDSRKPPGLLPIVRSSQVCVTFQKPHSDLVISQRRPANPADADLS